MRGLKKSAGLREARIRKIAREVIRREKAEGELSICFVEDGEMAELNGRYRGRKKPTDVLAFPADVKVSPLRLLGDVVISTQTASRQAKWFGHTEEDEVAFLLIHGILHLLGYDHHVSRDRKIMFQKQEELFWKIKANRS